MSAREKREIEEIKRGKCLTTLRKKEKERRGNKKGQVPANLGKEKSVRREVKMDKCLTVELGVQETHLSEKNK